MPNLFFSVNVLQLNIHPLKVGRLHRPVSVGLLQGRVLPVMMLMSIVLEYLRCLCWVCKIFSPECHILRQLGVIDVQLGPLGIGLQQLASPAPRRLLPQDIHYLLQQVLAVLRLLVLELLRAVDRRAADTCRHVMLRLISLVVGLLLLVIKVVLVQLGGRFSFAKLTECKRSTYEVSELLHPCLPGTVHGLVPC
jgi:hypothetical protein